MNHSNIGLAGPRKAAQSAPFAEKSNHGRDFILKNRYLSDRPQEKNGGMIADRQAIIWLKF
jgi:hypothetical protein